MNIQQLKTAIDAAILILADAEKITKQQLSSLSRTILQYIVVEKSTDIDTVNRLLNVLTPMNRQAANLYFEHFLPYAMVDGVFGEQIKKEKRFNAKVDAAIAWLEDEANDIWAWSEVNVEVKAKDYAGDIQKAIKAALKGNEKKGFEALTVRQVLNTVMDTEGVELGDLVGFLGDQAVKAQPVEEVAEAA